MKPITLPVVFTLLLSSFFGAKTHGQTFGANSSAVWISDCNQSNFYNTSGSGANLIGPAGNVFTGANLGAHTQNSGTLILRGAEVRTFKDPATSIVCGIRMYYRIYKATATPGTFSSIDLPLLNDCNVPSNQFPSGGACIAGDQKWNRVIPNGTTSPYAPVNLTSFTPGNYVLELFYEIDGSSISTIFCDDVPLMLNNSGNNYKAFFSIQAPVLATGNQTICNGQGSITISGLVAGTTYAISYKDDGNSVGPVNLVANGSGQVIITGLNAGTYSNFSLVVNGCGTSLTGQVILTNGAPPITPTLASSNPTTCNGTDGSITISGLIAGTTHAVSYTDDGNSVGPANLIANGSGQIILSGLNAGVYSNFSIVVNGCTTTINTTLVLSNGALVTPTLASNNPTTCNGTEGSITIGGLVAGTTYAIIYTDDGNPVGPANFVANGSGQVVISGLNAGVYSDFQLVVNGCTRDLNTGLLLSNPVFTPTFTNIAPFCAGSVAPTLATTSNNGLTGTWSPAVIDNQASGSYTFTPTAGQCGIPVTKNVTVNPKVTPTFSFGTSLTICAGGGVPALPSTSTNSITGTWSPSTVDNQNSAVYTFTPAAGQCALPTTFSVTVNPNITPTFSFGTSLTICTGASVPALPTTSDNSITGTWSPSTVDNQNSAVYTFTPAAGQCALPTIFSVTVNPNITPTFSFGTSLTICPGGAAPTLPTTSVNAINGTWSPSVIDNQNSGTYTFIPTAGVCAIPVTLTVTVSPNITPTFNFGTSLTICAGGSIPTLPTISTNSINGTWSPSTVDNQNSAVYTFTPAAGQCALPTTFSVTVNPNITPTFSFGTSVTICAGASVPALPTTSDNSVTGTWSPSAVDNQNSAVYTFTPVAGQCALPTIFSVTVNPNITPTFGFGTSLIICAGAIVPALPTTSDNGITGTWSPSTVDNQNSGTYTFTPTPGLCATNTTYNVTVTPNITPTFSFGTSLSICTGGSVPSLSNVSTNGINGTWSPSTVDDQNSATYTFTPTGGQCALPTTFAVTVNPIVTPAFSFGSSIAICAGSNAPTLPTTSTDAINGTWSPSTIDNQNSGVYTFTPTAGQCATTATLTVTISNNVTPTFNFGTSLTICAGAPVPALPTTSDNAISGTWSPSVVNNQSSGTYTFTPASGCATTASYSVTVNPNITPTFSFGTSLTICSGGTVPALSSTSINGITGSWSPSTIDNMASDTYIFTPAAGQCAISASFTVTINPILTPTFNFGTSLTICSGTSVPALPAISINNINGTWSPSSVDNQNSGTYTFTPTAGQCALPTTFTVTVTPTITPVFDFGTSFIICVGGTVPSLPTTSTNGIDGVWNPAVVNDQASAVYTFTPASTPAQCINTTTFTVTVNPILIPTFSFGTSLTICAGNTVPVLPTTSGNGITGTWTPALVNNQASGVYTFTTAPGQCATGSATLAVTVNPIPTVNSMANILVDDGTIILLNTLTGTPGGVSFSWTNTNTGIGLASSGTGNVPSFTAINKTDNPITGTITVTPTSNNCAGATKSYVITVRPLNKDVFVPNVFSPNGDGKNDVLLVYGNYIDKLEMRIFNQWGQQITVINSREKGWDGTQRGKAQPVGVYVYELQAVLSDKRTVKLKGYITLIR